VKCDSKKDRMHKLHAKKPIVESKRRTIQKKKKKKYNADRKRLEHQFVSQNTRNQNFDNRKRRTKNAQFDMKRVTASLCRAGGKTTRVRNAYG
jgi:hypothetical protein